MHYQIGDDLTCARVCACCFACHLVRALSSVMVPLNWLHDLCMSVVLVRCRGEPPLALGTISSTSARIGCGMQPVHAPLWHVL